MRERDPEAEKLIPAILVIWRASQPTKPQSNLRRKTGPVFSVQSTGFPCPNVGPSNTRN